ncbi:MAG: lysine--tRNA ligase [Candidatus Zambryskibacteria bacterium]|nr:lysine--tRNA ligase [Candidatus Zambryskibacteria bacterium]
MASLEEIRQARLAKLQKLKEHGVNPYPAKVPRDFSISELKKNFEAKSAQGSPVSVAGRVMALRGQGAILFVVLFDGTARIQAIIKKDVLSQEKFSLFVDTVDVSDFVSVTGKAILSERGEQSVLASSWLMATKSLLPLPEKWHGLQDYEAKFRHRYLDILFNPDVRDILEKKALFWNAVREFHTKHGFLEVETPVLEITTGGADAAPFETHHNALDLDVYLRISAGELWQKRLMVAGIPKTFEIGRIFRNEGMSPEHLQDYSQCEAYWAYANYEDMYKFLKECYCYVAEKTFGTLKFNINGFDIDLGGEWPIIDYTEVIQKETGMDIGKASNMDIEKKLDELGVEYEANNRGRIIDSLWKYCRKKIVGPAILVNEPKITSPLSKSSPKNPLITERFHFVIAGSEVGQGYSELNDPIDQRERFVEQEKLREAGDSEAQMADYDFVESLEHGMPPTAGHGFSERLFSFLINRPIRETQIFPLMKPQEERKKENYTVIAVVNSGAGLEPWQIMNTVAHLAAAFGARTKKKLFKFDGIKTKDNKNIKLNIQHAIMLKKAGSSEEIWKLSDTAQERGLEIAHFTREMIETTNDNKVAEQTKSKNYKDIDFLGLLIFGPKSEVDELTKDLELL